jgi:hypothetical protein
MANVRITDLDALTTPADADELAIEDASANATKKITYATLRDEITDGLGDVVGPASSIDNRIVRYDGTTGKLLQSSAVTIDDSGNIATAGTVDGRDLSVDGGKLDGIEDNANVTDAANVAAAGAIMYPGSHANGDILMYSGVVFARIPIGSDGQVLTVDAGGLIYADPASGAGTGDVVGPASAVDNRVARFDSTTGKLIQSSAVTIDDSGNITTAGTVDGRDISVDGTALDGKATGPASATDNAVARFDSTTGKLLQNSAVTVDDSGNIATPGTVDGRDLSVDGTKLDGIAASAAALTATTPSPLGTAAVGVATTAARADHVHAHGNLAGGSLHADASSGTAGFMPGYHFDALEAILAGGVGADEGDVLTLIDDGGGGLTFDFAAPTAVDATTVAAAGAVMDSDFAGSATGMMRRTGAGTYEVLKDNSTNTPPTVSDDSSAGYSVGSRWVATLTGTIYFAADVSVGAAVWRAVGGATAPTLDRSVSTDVSISNTTDEMIRVDASGGNRTLTLPHPANKRRFMIKKTSTGTNTISLARNGSEQIEGTAATYLLPGSDLTTRPAWSVWSDGTDWWVG